jgi:hypothetical protein
MRGETVGTRFTRPTTVRCRAERSDGDRVPVFGVFRSASRRSAFVHPNLVLGTARCAASSRTGHGGAIVALVSARGGGGVGWIASLILVAAPPLLAGALPRLRRATVGGAPRLPGDAGARRPRSGSGARCCSARLPWPLIAVGHAPRSPGSAACSPRIQRRAPRFESRRHDADGRPYWRGRRGTRERRVTSPTTWSSWCRYRTAPHLRRDRVLTAALTRRSSWWLVRVAPSRARSIAPLACGHAQPSLLTRARERPEFPELRQLYLPSGVAVLCGLKPAVLPCRLLG